MLKNIGTITSPTKEYMDELKSVLEDAGYELAYVNEFNASIIKEIEDLNE